MRNLRLYGDAVVLWIDHWSYGQIAKKLSISRSYAIKLFRVPPEIKQALKERAGGKCENCHIEPKQPETHHVIRDPEHKLENLQYLCMPCHRQLENIHNCQKATPEELERLKNKPWRSKKESSEIMKKHLDYCRSLDV